MARAIIQGFAEQGGYTITTDGRVSTTKAQRSFPGCQVDVFLAGTSTPATIFSDVGGTPKANPFIASTDGYWFFWADDGSYDVRFSGGGISTPFTLFNFTIGQSGALNDPGSNGILARTAANTVTPRTITGVTNETLVTNGNGVSGNPTIGLATFLEFTGRTLNGGTYLSPGIASFASAQHSHGDAVGGGQMNASNVFSSGTVPVARLPIMVGASAIAAGTAGLVPQPQAGDDDLFLRGDGTWQAAGGGGGGTPASPNLSVQYNNAGAFGGVTGTSSDGTQITFTDSVLRATSPRITTNIKDSNGNAIITLNAVGTAVNNLQIANAAAGGVPTITAIGTDANISISLTPKGTGVVSTPANVTISNLAPQITLIDTNDSKQIRLFLSGSNCGIINDTLGSTPLNIDTTNNQVNLAGNLVMASNTSISLTRNDNNVQVFYANSTGAKTWFTLVDTAGNFGLGQLNVSNWVTVAHTTLVSTFAAIPILPASNPTTDNQSARKRYVDDRSTWSKTWFYPVLPGAVETTESVGRFIVPANGKTITSITAVWASGSDSGASNIFTIKRRDSSGTLQSDVGTVDVNTPAQNALQESVVSVAVNSGDQIYPLFTTRNTASETLVSISIRGT